MKRIILGLLAVAVIKCPQNCVPHSGVCACDAPSESAEQTYVPSDEKPPNHGGKREEVNAVTPESLRAQDEQDDAESQRYYEGLSKKAQ